MVEIFFLEVCLYIKYGGLTPALCALRGVSRLGGDRRLWRRGCAPVGEQREMGDGAW